MTSSTDTPSNPDPPVRILVQTLTHLIPGQDGAERYDFMRNIICQHHWGCDFEGPRFRWAAYGTDFSLSNRRCFFLIDHGEADDDASVPVLYYEWGGHSLKPLPQMANNPDIQQELAKSPFTRPPPDPARPRMPARRFIKMAMYEDMDPPLEDVLYVRGHPEDLEWLKAHMRTRIWRKFVDYANLCDDGAPRIEY